MSIGLFFPRNVLSRNKVELHTSHHQLMDKLHEGWMIRGMFVDDFHHRCSICEEQDAPVTQLMTPHATARTIGRSSFTEMCVSCQVVGKCSWIHASLKSVPNTKPLARWRTSDDDQFTGMNDIVPMKTESNSNPYALHTSGEPCGVERICRVRRFKRRKKALPGVMTRQAKLRLPVTD